MNIHEMNEGAYLGNFGSDRIESILDEATSSDEVKKRDIFFIKTKRASFQTKDNDSTELLQYRRINNDNSN